MKNNFPAEFFRANREQLRELFTDPAPIVVTANGLLQRGGDGAFPFAQDANFWYLTGIDEPGVVLVIDADKDYLIVPELSEYQGIFDGGIDAAELMRRSGIATILSAKDGWKRLGARLKKVKQMATPTASPAYVETYGMYTNPARAVLIQKMQAASSELELLDARPALARLRMIKQPVELRALGRAIELTIGAFEIVQAKLPTLKYEYEIEAEITGHFVRRGALDAWKPIVAAGKNACVLHARDNRSNLAAGDLVVIDIGAEAEHYCADITRTISIGGQPSQRQQAVHAAVQAVQNFAIGLQKPGALVRENEKAVEQFMGEKLHELGLIKTLERKSIRKYFPHATSHFLGLDPHDAGDYDHPLEPGVVLTVEPGIYIPDEKIGVRIEDDVLITPTGHEILSRHLPRELI